MAHSGWHIVGGTHQVANRARDTELPLSTTQSQDAVASHARQSVLASSRRTVAVKAVDSDVYTAAFGRGPVRHLGGGALRHVVPQT